MARGSRNNRQIVPQSREALRQMKYEIAAEFGLPVGYGAGPMGSADTEFAGELGSIGNGHTTSSWGHLTSRENGSVGGEITKRLVAHAEQHFTL
ncbi:alpha/beta-type small acid-soluble spore protein [Paenibacillus sp. YPG26]|uniref:alpha/beta-type small acid-soluble spore protein n=1 Tax=Paenibacillus sp. YPG26 TaxID=2878915 RepID=UPI00203AA08F|nr:alpha/beta-type small acid-soluble spore protein [Paenibacillus sp. YPG26]USB32857.1 alpha/beta-type small acid-soluble spore protein [Paenibacillus sp. YPG26]